MGREILYIKSVTSYFLNSNTYRHYLYQGKGTVVLACTVKALGEKCIAALIPTLALDDEFP